MKQIESTVYWEVYEKVVKKLPDEISEKCNGVTDIIRNIDYIERNIKPKLEFLMQYAENKSEIKKAVNDSQLQTIKALEFATNLYLPKTPDEYFDLLIELELDRRKVMDKVTKFYLKFTAQRRYEYLLTESKLRTCFSTKTAAKSFNRLKRYWLAIKNEANRSYINSVSRLSKRHHVPLKPKPLEHILSVAPNNEVKEKLNNASLPELVMLYNLYRNRRNNRLVKNPNGQVVTVKRAEDAYNYDTVQAVVKTIYTKLSALLETNGYTGIKVVKGGKYDAVDYIMPDPALSSKLVAVYYVGLDLCISMRKQGGSFPIFDADTEGHTMYGFPYTNLFFSKQLSPNQLEAISYLLPESVRNLLTVKEIVRDWGIGEGNKPFVLSKETADSFEQMITKN